MILASYFVRFEPDFGYTQEVGKQKQILPTVGAVYDRAFFPEINEIRAVTDRAYRRAGSDFDSGSAFRVRDRRALTGAQPT